MKCFNYETIAIRSVSVRAFLTLVAVAGALPTTATGIITVTDRDSEAVVNPANLGYEPLFVDVDPGDLVDTASDLSNMAGAGPLYYGPDFFDQINSGTYSYSQNLGVSATQVSIDLQQNGSASQDQGVGSPQVEVDNSIYLYFTVSEDTNASLYVFIDGTTNVGIDQVDFRLREVTVGDGIDPSTDSIEATLFNEAASLTSGEDDTTVNLLLEASKTYRIYANGRARAFDTSSGTESPTESQVTAVLTIPEPTLGLLAFGSVPLFCRRRR